MSAYRKQCSIVARDGAISTEQFLGVVRRHPSLRVLPEQTTVPDTIAYSSEFSGESLALVHRHDSGRVDAVALLGRSCAVATEVARRLDGEFHCGG
jgi:hypothetical protein